jgi:hypothetical protein
MKKLTALVATIVLALQLNACGGGGGGGSSAATTTPIAGVATPGAVSVVTAK